MSHKGYCSTEDISDFLGVAFTPAQQVHAERLIERVEGFIDEDTARGWLAGVQTGETPDRYGDDLYLRYAPVVSIQEIRVRYVVGGTDDVLAATSYELRNPEWGIVRLIGVSSYDLIFVDYTPGTTVPGPITQAAIELTALWMQSHLRPDSYGLDSFSLPDLSVKFSRAHVQAGLPPTVQDILDLYRYRVHA